MNKDTGGSAFPEVISDYNDDTHQYMNVHSVGGITVRDYFAANAPELAVIGIKQSGEILAGRKTPEDNAGILEELKFNAEIEAAIRYIYADAMIAERNKS
jgi:hypothetical protein